MEDYNKTEILKEALHRLNMKNTDLAALTGKHYMTVSKWITGKAKIPEYVLLAILKHENKRYREITGKLEAMPEAMRERLKVATSNISADPEV